MRTAMNLLMAFGETPTWLIACTRAGAPIDLTGATVKFAAKSKYGPLPGGVADPDITHTSAAGGGIVVVAPAANGNCNLTLTVADTAALDPTTTHRYRYDVRVVEANGVETVVQSGELVVTPSETAA